MVMTQGALSERLDDAFSELETEANWLALAAAVPADERAKILANPEPTPSTTVDPIAARAIGRMLEALDDLEQARQRIGDELGKHGRGAIEAEAALRHACGRVEAAAAELCTWAAGARKR